MKFERIKLIDISRSITDGTHSTVNDQEDGAYYLLSCKNIKNGKINIGAAERRVGEETFLKLRKRTRLEKDDVLITTVGTIGEMAIVTDTQPWYEFQRSVGIIKPNTEVVIPTFLYYALKNQYRQIMTLVKGAVQQCLFLGDIKNIEVDLPDMASQKSISDLLQLIDKKIEMNEQINKNLAA